MANYAKTPDDLKSGLYKAFNKALDKMEDNYEIDKIEKLARVAADIADRIVGIERDQALLGLIKQAKENGRDIEIDLDKRVIRSIAPATGSRVKTL